METFQQIISGEMPVLVDFHATWCGPCKAMGPAVASLGREVQGKARVLKLDIDKAPDVARRFGVQAVPTFIIFKQGKAVWRHAGMADAHSLKRQLLAFAN